jgi:uncharacterized protein (UPF0332 family)
VAFEKRSFPVFQKYFKRRSKDLMSEQVAYRIERAKETYRDAVLLLEKGSLNSCINRLYYSVFYASIALLLTRGLEVKSHNGVKRKIGNLVVEGIIKKENAKIFGVLSDFRNKGDYDDLFDFSRETVEKLMNPAFAYIEDIEIILKK